LVVRKSLAAMPFRPVMTSVVVAGLLVPPISGPFPVLKVTVDGPAVGDRARECP